MLFETINKDLTAAMKAKDSVRLGVLRMMKSKVLNVNARGDLPDAEIIKILQAYSKALKESAEIMAQHGKSEDADIIKKELSIISEYLPKMLDEEATKTLVKETAAQLNITSPKQMGLIMKEIMGKRNDVDGSLVRKIASEILQ